MPASDANRVVMVANPAAGGGRARGVAIDTARAMRKEGVDVDLHLPLTLQELHSVLADACAAGPATLVACGGDGTVHQVLQAVMASSSTLGVIPAGTGNDIARSLGIPHKDHIAWANKTAHMIRDGRSRQVDVAQITHDGGEEWSLGVISTGFDSAVNERADRMTRLSGTPRYVVALLSELRDFRLHDYAITLDGVAVTGRALLVAIGNGISYGGGMRICPEADMDDGLLDVTWVDAAPRRTVLRFFPQVFSGRHIHHPLVSTYRAREITIEARGTVIYADGDRVGPPPARIVAVPGALRVLAPVLP